ncbi:hypothetical protein OKA04_09475 [Luteolibacter flavescens]|uniref:PBP domain-containing protein n=1 Tax=Luteolibacter flavescens TaxID=1859460 RepID=A0ABT3FN14_9BACT|nr:hypothetical protein [Luteolibacter flavescens]MCW1884957.1 hypothetical protein [Luteolibacter flavescens]
MKATTTLAILALAAGSVASGQTVINITGATAFRAAATNTIIAMLGGNGVTQFGYDGTSGPTGANRQIFRGTFNGQDTIIRTSWSGSTQGILDLADQNQIQFLIANFGTGTGANPISTTGYNYGAAGNEPAEFNTGIPRFAFSDVDKALSTRPNATLSGGPVGVVPFMFLAGESAPATMTNITDQQHEALWSLGQMPLSLFTGNAADTDLVLATGRNNGSGTRATILAETGYGAFTNVQQWNAAFTGDRVTGTLTTISEFENNGHSSNSGVRDVLTRPSNNVTYNGNSFSVVFCGYLTISDALAASGYNPVTGAVSGGEGAKPMTYNGVRYSEENVKNGAYTLWGYQQLYRASNATQAEIAFDDALRAAVPVNMGTAGIPIPQMTVNRSGGDGGLVLPIPQG